MYRVYIVEDETALAEEIEKLAVSWQLQVKISKDFKNIVGEVAQYNPHIILLDIVLPFYNGFYWCGEIRKFSNVPIIFISSASDNMNMVMAMNMGADDFIPKPFDGNVLMAKIQALLRRSYDFALSSPVIEYKGALLDTGNGTLVYNGEKISLTKNEYRILKTLMENKGKTVTREMLMEKLWDTDIFIDDNTLTVNINRLRKKLESKQLKDFITTKFGEGYILE